VQVLDGHYNTKNKLVYATDNNGLDLTTDRMFDEYIKIRETVPHKVVTFNTYLELLKHVEEL
jgi:hypothetical protein